MSDDVWRSSTLGGLFYLSSFIIKTLLSSFGCHRELHAKVMLIPIIVFLISGTNVDNLKSPWVVLKWYIYIYIYISRPCVHVCGMLKCNESRIV